MELAIAGAELLMHKAAWVESTGQPFVAAATQALVAASEAASRVTDTALQLFGGYGITEEFDVERYWRDARVFRLSPVTSEVAKNVLAHHLGLPKSF
jgi:alkylation response protein AidB-like acyl-CoA dehydrogenase